MQEIDEEISEVQVELDKIKAQKAKELSDHITAIVVQNM